MPVLSTPGLGEKHKQEHHEEVEINTGRGNVNWAPNLKKARLGEGELN